MKRWLTFILVMVLAFSPLTPCGSGNSNTPSGGLEEPQGIMPEMPVNPFGDVFGADWFIDDVIYVSNEGLMGGSVDATLFSPDMALTRGMVATVLGRFTQVDAVAAVAPFTDVDDNAYYAPYVYWAAENDVVSGYGDSRFGPDDYITREQLASVIYRFQQFSGKTPAENLPVISFNDAEKISSWAAEAVSALSTQGVISGKPGNSFDPQGYATRAEFAAIMHRFLTRL